MKPAYIMALVLIVISMAITLYTFSISIAQHVSITQAVKMPGQQVQVPGKILKDTVFYDAAKSELRFDIQDLKGTDKLTIVYREPKPENFDSATSVEAVGTFKDGTFYAKNLLVKCPSKYNDENKKSDAGSAFGIAATVTGLSASLVGGGMLMHKRGLLWK